MHVTAVEELIYYCLHARTHTYVAVCCKKSSNSTNGRQEMEQLYSFANYLLSLEKLALKVTLCDSEATGSSSICLYLTEVSLWGSCFCCFFHLKSSTNCAKVWTQLVDYHKFVDIRYVCPDKLVWLCNNLCSSCYPNTTTSAQVHYKYDEKLQDTPLVSNTVFVPVCV